MEIVVGNLKQILKVLGNTNDTSKRYINDGGGYIHFNNEYALTQNASCTTLAHYDFSTTASLEYDKLDKLISQFDSSATVSISDKGNIKAKGVKGSYKAGVGKNTEQVQDLTELEKSIDINRLELLNSLSNAYKVAEQGITIDKGFVRSSKGFDVQYANIVDGLDIEEKIALTEVKTIISFLSQMDSFDIELAVFKNKIAFYGSKNDTQYTLIVSRYDGYDIQANNVDYENVIALSRNIEPLEDSARMHVNTSQVWQYINNNIVRLGFNGGRFVRIVFSNKNHVFSYGDVYPYGQDIHVEEALNVKLDNFIDVLSLCDSPRIFKLGNRVGVVDNNNVYVIGSYEKN